MSRRSAIARSWLGLGLVVGVAAACSSPPPPEAIWVKQGAGEAELATDEDACLREAADLQGAQKRFDHVARGSAFMRCMTARGWRQEASDPAP